MKPSAESLIPQPVARKAAGLALASVAIVVCSVAAYMLLMDVPWVRASGAPAWIGFALAALLALLAIRRDRRIWVRAIAGLTLAFILFGVYAFFGLARLPQNSALARDARIPAVSLPDQDNRVIDVNEAARAGPTLLVFYRGFW